MFVEFKRKEIKRSKIYFRINFVFKMKIYRSIMERKDKNFINFDVR